MPNPKLGTMVWHEGVLVSLSHTLLEYLRAIGCEITNALTDQISRTVYVPSGALYHDVREWIVNHPSSRRVTRFQADKSGSSGGQDFYLLPAASVRVLRHDGKWLVARFHGGMQYQPESSPDDAATPSAGTALVGISKGPSALPLGINQLCIELTLIGARSADELRNLLTDISASSSSRRKQRTTHSIYENRNNHWARVFDKPLRPTASVILSEDTSIDSLIEDVRRFFADKAWYEEMGIPHHRGYLFEGIAGMGKTSAITAIASAMGMDLCILRLASAGMSDDTLAYLRLQVPNGAMMLIEDIDAAFSGRVRQIMRPGFNKQVTEQYNEALTRRAESEGLTFSGLLNTLDGVGAPGGLVTFMTTNHVDQLDRALIRPGRVDRRVTFTHATASQITRLYERFYPGESSSDAARFGREMALKKVTMAEMQEFLLYRRDDPLSALADAHEYKTSNIEADAISVDATA